MLNDKRVILVKKKLKSDWTSCQSITRNIELSYREIFREENIHVFEIDLSFNLFELAIEIEKMDFLKPDYIVWIDHLPNPSHFVRLFDTCFENIIPKANLPHFIFHLFGDFALQASQWIECQNHLSHYKTTFFCASLAQKKLVDSFLRDQESFLIPFPTDPSRFFFSMNERDSFRRHYKLSDNQHAILYTGRVSLQKNVIELIKSFIKTKQLLPPGTKLFFAGKFDDLNIPYLGLSGEPGSFKRYWQHALGDISEDEDIIYLGDLDTDQLRCAYNGCDLFVSLSTHNDEDYGMSPAEGLMTGLPCMLTKWGGFQSFHDLIKGEVTLTPVKIVPGRIAPDLVQFQKSIIALFSPFSKNNQRADQAIKNQELLSIHYCSQLIERHLQQAKHSHFQGFNRRFEKFAAYFALSPRAPFKEAGTTHYNQDYFKFYRPYFDHHDEGV
jgi:glycosyltransferase involved in cell wall biosynthesis